jgi:hypothetical protein
VEWLRTLKYPAGKSASSPGEHLSFDRKMSAREEEQDEAKQRIELNVL